MEEPGFDELVMECSKCHLKFLAPQLRLDPKTDLMVCPNCSKLETHSRVMIIKDRPPRKRIPE